MTYVCVTEVSNEILIHGDECVINLEDLYCALADPECTEVRLTKEFVDKFFTYTALCDFVENCASVAPNAAIIVEGTEYSDMPGAVKSLSRYKSVEEFNYALSYNPTKTIATIQDLCKYYSETRDEATVAASKLSSAVMQLEQAIREKDEVLTDYDKLLSTYNETVAKFEALVNRVNFRYEKTINPDEMFLVRDNKFKRILYIKEITRVHYVDTLLHYLRETLMTLYNVPARSLVIEPYYSYGRESMYPDYKPHWNLTYQDVYSGNILMAGFQPKLMKDIMLNSNHVHYLIILDRGGYMTPHVEGSNVSVLYTASDLKDVPESIDRSKVISYSEDSLYIPYVDGFEELSPEEKVQKYSSMSVTQALIDVLEEDL